MTKSKQTQEVWEKYNGEYKSDIPFEDQDVCEGCQYPIIYYSPENFSPICTDSETGEVHCEGCCGCEEVTALWEIIYKTNAEG